MKKKLLYQKNQVPVTKTLDLIRKVKFKYDEAQVLLAEFQVPIKAQSLRTKEKPQIPITKAYVPLVSSYFHTQLVRNICIFSLCRIWDNKTKKRRRTK